MTKDELTTLFTWRNKNQLPVDVLSPGERLKRAYAGEQPLQRDPPRQEKNELLTPVQRLHNAYASEK
jgi:hypothetical protein